MRRLSRVLDSTAVRIKINYKLPAARSEASITDRGCVVITRAMAIIWFTNTTLHVACLGMTGRPLSPSRFSRRSRPDSSVSWLAKRGHPWLYWGQAAQTWMAATSAAMTRGGRSSTRKAAQAERMVQIQGNAHYKGMRISRLKPGFRICSHRPCGRR